MFRKIGVRIVTSGAHRTTTALLNGTWTERPRLRPLVRDITLSAIVKSGLLARCCHTTRPVAMRRRVIASVKGELRLLIRPYPREVQNDELVLAEHANERGKASCLSCDIDC